MPLNLNLKKPCKNCPFLVKGAIELSKGRIDQIVRDIVADDKLPFLCHKTVHGKNADGQHIENDDGTSTYIPGDKDSVCVGSMVLLLKVGAPNVAMRMGAAFKMVNFDELRAMSHLVVDPATLDLEVHDKKRARSTQRSR